MPWPLVIIYTKEQKLDSKNIFLWLDESVNASFSVMFINNRVTKEVNTMCVYIASIISIWKIASNWWYFMVIQVRNYFMWRIGKRLNDRYFLPERYFCFALKVHLKVFESKNNHYIEVKVWIVQRNIYIF